MRVNDDESVSASEWGGHFYWQKLDEKIAELEAKASRFLPSRERSRELAHLKTAKAEMEALRKAWMRSVVEECSTPLHVVLLQMDELAHAGLSFDCLLPEDFTFVHSKFPDFVPGPRGVENGTRV